MQEQEATGRQALETTLSGLRDASARMRGELGRLITLAKSSDRAPTTLLREMHRLETELAATQNAAIQTELEIETIAVKDASVRTTGDLIRTLGAARDDRSLLRVRREIRHRVERIDVFPRGTTPDTASGSGGSSGQPCFKVRVANSVERWAFCSHRKPCCLWLPEESTVAGVDQRSKC